VRLAHLPSNDPPSDCDVMLKLFTQTVWIALAPRRQRPGSPLTLALVRRRPGRRASSGTGTVKAPRTCPRSNHVQNESSGRKPTTSVVDASSSTVQVELRPTIGNERNESDGRPVRAIASSICAALSGKRLLSSDTGLATSSTLGRASA